MCGVFFEKYDGNLKKKEAGYFFTDKAAAIDCGSFPRPAYN
jgi:hypothetical protein